jgi:hypothetical protein
MSNAVIKWREVTEARCVQANFTPRIDPSAEDRWSAAEEPLAWAHSRVASYNPAQRLFKCADCECVGFLARIAEHWLGTHSQVPTGCSTVCFTLRVNGRSII